MVNKYVCGRGEAQKKQKRAGSDSLEIVFDLAELSHLQLKCLDLVDQEKCHGFLNSLNQTIPRCGNYR